MAKEKFQRDFKFISKKIDEYESIIAFEFYQKVAKQFKEIILQKFSEYRTIDEKLLDKLLDTSYFKKVCFSDLDFTLMESDLYWVNSLVKSFENTIDFESLKKYEESKVENISFKNKRGRKNMNSHVHYVDLNNNFFTDFKSDSNIDNIPKEINNLTVVNDI